MGLVAGCQQPGRWGTLGAAPAYVVVAHPGRVAAVQQGDLRPPLVSRNLGGVPVGLAERPQGRMGHPCDNPATRARALPQGHLSALDTDLPHAGGRGVVGHRHQGGGLGGHMLRALRIGVCGTGHGQAAGQSEGGRGRREAAAHSRGHCCTPLTGAALRGALGSLQRQTGPILGRSVTGFGQRPSARTGRRTGLLAAPLAPASSPASGIDGPS